MAIQVSGTTVINDSRQLQNIASLDSTSAAAITAAGVGGGGEQTFTAASAVSTGDVVGMRSDGKIQTMEALDTGGSVESASGLSGIYMGSSFQPPYNKIIYNHNGTRVLHLTAVQTTSTYYSNSGWWVCGGSVAANGTITWGTRSLIYQMSNAPGYAGTIEYLPTDNNTWIVSVNNQGVTNSQTRTWAIQVSSAGALTVGTPYSVSSYNCYSNHMDVFPTGQVIITYNSSGTPRQRFRVLSVSGTTLTAGTQYTINANTLSNCNVRVNPNTGKFVIVSQVASGRTFLIGTVSGTTLSYTTSGDTSGWSATSNGLEWLSDTDFHEGNSGKIYRINGSNAVSELTTAYTRIPRDSSVSGHYDYPRSWGIDWSTYDLWGIAFDTVRSAYVLMKMVYNGDGSFTKAMNSISMNGSFHKINLSYYKSSYSGGGKVALGHFYYTQTSPYSTTRVDTHIFNKGDFVNDAYVGIAKENISANATGKVAVSGGIAGGQTGLSTGSSYGINLSTGQLYSTLSEKEMIAISSTSVLLF